MRNGPRSTPTAFSVAVADELNRRMRDRGWSINRLGIAVAPEISRSQLYLLMDGAQVLDVAELDRTPPPVAGYEI